MNTPLNRPTRVKFCGVRLRSTRLVSCVISTLGVLVFYALFPWNFYLQAILVVLGIWGLVFWAETGNYPLVFVPRYYQVRLRQAQEERSP